MQKVSILRCVRDVTTLSLGSPVNERIATIRLKAEFYNISLIFAHTPVEEKNDMIRDSFYAELGGVYDKCRVHDAKVVLGDINAKVGREGISYHYLQCYEADRFHRGE